MKKDLERVIEIPEGVECAVNGKNVLIKGNGKELSKEFDIGKLSLAAENNSLKISCKNLVEENQK